MELLIHTELGREGRMGLMSNMRTNIGEGSWAGPWMSALVMVVDDPREGSKGTIEAVASFLTSEVRLVAR